MSNNIKVLNKQIELFIVDFFVDKNLYENTPNIRDYLVNRLDSLVELSRVDLTIDEFNESFINICDKYGILSEISDSREESIKSISDLIENKLTLDNELITQIEDHFHKSIKNKDINLLYEKDWFAKRELSTSNISNILNTNKEIDIKEMVGVVNTFIENSDINNLAPSIKKIARGINQKSISNEPFKLIGDNVQYQRSGSGEFDFFMYDKKSKSYSISMSTKSQTTKIEGSSPFRHSLALYYMVAKAHETSKRLKNPNLTEREHILEFENQIVKMDYFRTHKLNNTKLRNPETKSDKIRKNIKTITKNTDLIIKEFIDMGILDKSVIKAESVSSKHKSYTLKKKDMDKIKDHIKNIGVECKIYYFGDVISSNKKENTYSEIYSNEEIRAAANIFAYSNVGNNGFSGVNLSPIASTDFCNELNVRFNTSTTQSKNCVNLISLNNNLDKMVGVIINEFTQFKDIDSIYKYYDRNSIEKENKDVLENITKIEGNLIDIISEEIDNGVDPDTSYLLALSRFNVTPKLNIDQFLENMSSKYKIINESMVNDANLKIDNLKNKITNSNDPINISEDKFKMGLREVYKEEIMSLDNDYKSSKITQKEYQDKVDKIDKSVDDMYSVYQKARKITLKSKIN